MMTPPSPSSSPRASHAVAQQLRTSPAAAQNMTVAQHLEHKARAQHLDAQAVRRGAAPDARYFTMSGGNATSVGYVTGHTSSVETVQKPTKVKNSDIL